MRGKVRIWETESRIEDVRRKVWCMIVLTTRTYYVCILNMPLEQVCGSSFITRIKPRVARKRLLVLFVGEMSKLNTQQSANSH